jgi:hypothetical protein
LKLGAEAGGDAFTWWRHLERFDFDVRCAQCPTACGNVASAAYGVDGGVRIAPGGMELGSPA